MVPRGEMILWVYFRIAFWHDTFSQLLVVTTVAPRFLGPSYIATLSHIMLVVHLFSGF